jgi:hypothetical protein
MVIMSMLSIWRIDTSNEDVISFMVRSSDDDIDNDTDDKDDIKNIYVWYI